MVGGFLPILVKFNFMAQIATLTFFRYTSLPSKAWGFFMMQFAHPHLQRASGCQFYKLMGSGKGNGFNPYPDWSVYSLLQVWENEEAASEFFTHSTLMKKYQRKSSECWTVFLKNIAAKGHWSGKNPFEPSGSLDANNPLIAVITRATIRKRHLRKFWNYVPHSEKPLTDASGLIYTKGIGEVPVVQMATFSIWSSLESLQKFAYQSKEHVVAIEKTRHFDWYKEEMFSRFQPYKSIGKWQGEIMLPELDAGPDFGQKHQ